MPLPSGLRASRHIAACVALFATLSARRAAAAELPGARLEVSRHAGAETCPDADQLAAELSGRMGPRSPADAELLVFSIELEGNAETYAATVRVDGRKHGERTLRAAGPTCDPLRDALVVTLLVLLDEERAATLETPTTAAAATSAATAASPAPPGPTQTKAPPEPTGEQQATVAEESVAPRERRSSPATLWVAVGGGVTHGLPESWSGVLLFDLSGRFRAFEVSAGGFWAPSQHISSGDDVDTKVSASGGRVRGCYGFHPAATTGPRVLGCATGLFAALSGSATGTEVQSTGEVTKLWSLLGLSLEATLPLTERIDAGISLAGLATVHNQAFTVGSLSPYETDAVVGILALRLEARLF